ncbi:MAG TPA: glycosyltransferase family 39 protein [Candidatus Nitrosocosmicus sp.]|nr:glycosyltransferase family 39 protein [Candidatus Nitrosocosmicus sp.]
MIKKYSSAIKVILLLFILTLFCYFRLKPIYNQTVPYTYDQGRDFAKAAEIILDKKPTFLGPTTGIQGLFHGSWWYYALTVPFILTQGNPIGFYYFIFFVQLVSFILLLYFLKRYFSLLTAFIIGALMATSPYFISTSFFAGNNIMVLPFLLIFLLLNFYLLEGKIKKKNHWMFFFAGISLGLVAEFEFAFGLLIIPAYFILLFATHLRKQFLRLKNAIFFLVGLLIPFIPRILFEVRHDFLQTRTMLNFLIKPKLHNPKSYMDIVQDRLNLFIGYWKSIFDNEYISLIIFLLFLMSMMFAFKHKDFIYKRFFYFLLTLLGLLFLFSTFYKDNFWANYYEGIHYIFIMLLAFTFTVVIKKYSTYMNIVKGLVLVSLLVLGIFNFYRGIDSKPKLEGLMMHKEIVSYIQNKERNNEYCIKVYTPPVIPHTYNYLFIANNYSQKIPKPKDEWQHNKCWFIIEDDQYSFRRNDWIRNNIPQEGKLVERKRFAYINVELWQK